MFSLPGRGFHQRATLISSVPMTLDDVIVHVRQFIIALVSVDGCSSFSDPDGFFDVPDSSVGFGTSNKPSGSEKLEHPSTETRAIMNCLTCTMTSSSVIGTDEINVTR